jgi:hypothetical protein
MDTMVSPDAVLDNPQRALPNVASALGTPDRMIAMVSALAEATVVRAKKTPGNDPFVAYLRALAWVTETGGREYVATSVSAFTRHKGDFGALRAAVAASRADARVNGMLKALAACLKEA